MRRALEIALLVAVVFTPAAASAACSRDAGAPAFTVTLRDQPVNYRLTVDTAALVRIAGENGMAGLKGEIPYGLTIGRYDLEVAVETDEVRDGGGYCADLHGAHVEIGLRQLDVLIDRRFAEGSCEREAVLEHENQHVDVFREAMHFYLPAIERALANAAFSVTVHVVDREAARAAFFSPITDSVKPIFDAINSRARDGNAHLDSPENYAAVFRRCSNW